MCERGEGRVMWLVRIIVLVYYTCVYYCVCICSYKVSVGVLYYTIHYTIRYTCTDILYYTTQWITQSVEAKGLVQDDIVDYLEAKQQLLLAYCMNITFYLYLKVQHIYIHIY